MLFSRNWVYWNGIKLYNNVVPIESQIRVEDIQATSIESEQTRVDLILEEGEFSLYHLVLIEEGAMISGRRLTKVETKQILNNFNDFKLNYDVYSTQLDYALSVAQTQWFGGAENEALKIMDSLKESVQSDKASSDFVERYYLTRAGMNLTYSNYEEVLSNLGQVKSEKYECTVESIKKYMYEVLGQNVAYIDSYAKQFKPSEHLYAKFYKEIDEINDYINYTYNGEVTTETDKIVSGHVTIDGQAYEGAILYEKYHSGMSSGMAFDRRYSVSNSDGYYEIHNMYSDTRMIGIMLPWHLVQNKQWISQPRSAKLSNREENDITYNYTFTSGVRFKSLEISGDNVIYEIEDPNASPGRVYNLSVHQVDPAYDSNIGYIGVEIAYDNMKGTLSLSDLRSESTFAFEYSSSKDTLHVNRFMEPLYLSDNYYFKVYPYEKESDDGIQNGLFTDWLSTNIYVEGESDYNEGDKLLNSRKVEDAIQWYSENPSEHNLKVLYSLYEKGYIPVDNEYYQELEGSDHELAIVYLKQLIDLYGSSERRLGDLADLYRELGRYNEEETIRQQLLEIDASSSYYNITYAKSIMHQGKYKEAVDHLLKYGDPENEADRYYPEFIIGHRLELLPEDLKQGLYDCEDINDYKAYHELVQNGLYDQAWTHLQSMEDSSIKTFYTLLMLDGIRLDSMDFDRYKEEYLNSEYDDFVEYYIKATEEIEALDTSNKGLVKILKYIKINNNWFNNYN